MGASQRRQRLARENGDPRVATNTPLRAQPLDKRAYGPIALTGLGVNDAVIVLERHPVRKRSDEVPCGKLSFREHLLS